MHEDNPRSTDGSPDACRLNEHKLFPLPSEISLDEIILRIRAELERKGFAMHGVKMFDDHGTGEDKMPDEDLSSSEGLLRAVRDLAVSISHHGGSRSDLIMDRVNTERMRKSTYLHSRASLDADKDNPDVGLSIRYWKPASSGIALKKAYTLNELLAYSDADFVETVYRVLLRRPADAAGRDAYLSALRSGVLSKVEVLGRIRFSSEGVQHGVHVEGLLLPYKLRSWCRIPFVGRALSSMMALVRLPRIMARIQAVEETSARETQRLGGLINENYGAVVGKFAQLDERFVEHDSRFSEIEASIRRWEGDSASLSAMLHEQDQRQVERIESMSAVLQERIRQMENLFTTNNARYEALSRDATQARRSLEERLEGLGQSLGQVSIKLEQLAFRDDVKRVVDRQQIIHGSIEKLVEKFNSLQATQRETHEQLQAFQESKSAIQQLASLDDDWHERFMGRLETNSQAIADVQKEMEQAVHGDIANLSSALESLVSVQQELESQLKSFAESKDAVEAVASLDDGWHEQIQNSMRANREAIDRLGGEMRKLNAVSINLDASLHRARRGVLDLQKKLIDVVVKTGESGPEATTVEDILAPEYADFEDIFRGTREDIKNRASVYLEVLSRVGIKAGQELILDLGCGRGEWLELLGEHGYLCRGIDLNPVQLKEAADHGADVEKADALKYLSGLGEGTVAAITAMHLVEHLPHEMLMRLFDECRRVLRPGGVLILETPNPENLTVGACWFYLDPTHRNPIPPQLLQWQVTSRGFSDVEIMRLSEHRGMLNIERVPDDTPGAAQVNRLIELVTCATDYAVTAINA